MKKILSCAIFKKEFLSKILLQTIKDLKITSWWSLQDITESVAHLQGVSLKPDPLISPFLYIYQPFLVPSPTSGPLQNHSEFLPCSLYPLPTPFTGRLQSRSEFIPCSPFPAFPLHWSWICPEDHQNYTIPDRIVS